MKTKDSISLLGWLLLLSISLIYFCSNLQKVLVPGATFNELQAAFNADAASITRLGAAFMYTYAVMQLVTGLLADRYGGARVIAAGGFIFCFGAIMSAFPASIGLMLASRICTGFGAGLVYLSALKEVARLAPNSLSVFVGLLTLVGYSGSLVGTSPFIAGLHAFGYRPMMLGAGVLLVAVFAFFLLVFFNSRLPPVSREVHFSPRAYLSVIKVRHNVYQILSVGIAFGLYYSMQSIFGKKYLEDYCGIGSGTAGYFLLGSMLISSSSSIILAYVSRFMGERRLPFLRFAGCGCFAGVLLIFLQTASGNHSPVIAGIAIFLLAWAGNMSSINVATLKEVNDEKSFGTVMSVSNFFAYLVTACAGGSAGKLMDVFAPSAGEGGVLVYGRSSYMLLFGVLLAAGAVSAFSCLKLKETKHSAG